MSGQSHVVPPAAATTPDTKPDGSKAIFELIVATIPAALLYFFGWAYLHFYLKAFSIDLSELELDLQTMFIYSVPPLRAVMSLYWLWGIVLAIVVLIWMLQWIVPRFYRRVIELPAIVYGLTLFGIFASLAVASVPMIRLVATDAANRKWSSGPPGIPMEAIAKEVDAKDGSLWYNNYRKCSKRRGLDLIFADKASYYMLCISQDDKALGVVFEVRREAGLVSVRFVQPAEIR